MRSKATTVGEYCVREVVTAGRDTPIVACAKRMHDEHVGSLVVVEQRDGLAVPVGIVTDRDIAIEVVAFEVDASTLTAGDDDLLSVLAVMREHGVRRLPVVDAAGALAGIVSADNLLEVLAEEIDGLVRVVKAEQSRERSTRASAS